jgi:hypothetical protein
MILSSVNDESLFDPESGRQLGYDSWLVMYLLSLCHSHVLVCKGGLKLRESIKCLIANLDCSDEIKAIIKASLEDENGQKLVALNSDMDAREIGRVVDVFISANQSSLSTIAAEWGLDPQDSRLCCWYNYHKSANSGGGQGDVRCTLLDYMGRGAVSIKGWKADSFKKQVLRPTLRWSTYVHLWDRYFGIACEENGKNKQSYLETICMIVREWINSCVWSTEDIGDFVIYTTVSDPRRLTCMLLNRLQHIPEAFKAKIIIRAPTHCERVQNDASHDRYMRTSVANLSFSRGFDIIIPKHSCCRECTVSIVRRMPSGLF